jgi:molybdopterin-binding protein
LLGTVLEVTIEGLLAKVVLPVGTQRLTAIATADAPENSLLRPSDEAVALIKATEVMIGRLGRMLPAARPQHSKVANIIGPERSQALAF